MSRFRKGQPSANPHGRRGAPGFDGVYAASGYLQSGEKSPNLNGAQRWKTLSTVRRRAPVSVATQLRAALFTGVQWSLEPNEAGGTNAERGVEIVRRGLVEARFVGGRSWPHVVAKAADGRYFLGHSIFATEIAAMRSGLIGYTDIAHRPQHTIEQWWRAVPNDESTPFVAVEQRSTMGATQRLELRECLYLANDASTDSPQGRAVLADVAERYDRIASFEALEGTELFSSMGGTPIARMPLGDLKTAAPGATDDDKLAWISTKIAPVIDFISKRIKTPNLLQWLQLDSATYQGADPNTISGIPKWDIQILKGELQGVTEMRAIIRDLDLDIARMLGVEFIFVGGGDTAGSFGMHESKISMLGASLSAESWAIARAAEDQLARRLIAANGLDPDTCTPSLVPSPIAVDDVLKATQALAQLGMAGLPRNHPAKRTIFDRLHLPYEEEGSPSVALPGFGQPRPAMPGADDVLGEPTPEQATKLSKKGAAS